MICQPPWRMVRKYHPFFKRLFNIIYFLIFNICLIFQIDIYITSNAIQYSRDPKIFWRISRSIYSVGAFSYILSKYRIRGLNNFLGGFRSVNEDTNNNDTSNNNNKLICINLII